MSSSSPFDWQFYVLKDYSFTEFARKALVLDIGCGEGLQLRDLVKRECRAFGIEPDWMSLAECRKQGLSVVHAVAEELPVKGESVNGVICKGVLPYTDEPRAFREIHRILKPGGRLVIVDWKPEETPVGPPVDHRLPPEQVRDAASTWMEAQDLPPSARRKRYGKAARRIAYHQRRNRQARASHTKTTHRTLRKMGIRVDRLRSCAPDDP